MREKYGNDIGLWHSKGMLNDAGHNFGEDCRVLKRYLAQGLGSSWGKEIE